MCANEVFWRSGFEIERDREEDVTAVFEFLSFYFFQEKFRCDFFGYSFGYVL